MVEFNSVKMNLFLEPFYMLLASTDNNKVFERIQNSIFDPLYEMNTIKSGMEESPEPKIKIVTNLKSITDKLFELASDKETRPTNHKKIYALWEKFNKAIIQPSDDNKDNSTVVSTDNDDSEMKDANNESEDTDNVELKKG